MDASDLLVKARSVRLAAIAAQPYSVNWRGGQSSVVIGIQAVSDALRIRVKTLRCYLSTGKGQHIRTATNPLTGELDVVTVTKLAIPAKAPKQRGRPPGKATLQARAQAEQELAEQRAQAAERLPAAKREAGTKLAPPAKTVPKTRNRRTDDKR